MKNNSHQKAAAIALAFLDMGRTGSHFSYLCHCLNRVSGLAARNLEKEIEKRWLLKLAKELDYADAH